MAEVFAIVASALACSELLGKISLVSAELYESAKDAPQALQTLRKETASFQRLLSVVKREVEYEYSDLVQTDEDTCTTSRRLECLQEPLEEFTRTLDSIMADLDELKMDKLRNRVRWAITGERRAGKRLLELAKYRALFTAAFEADDRYVGVAGYS